MNKYIKVLLVIILLLGLIFMVIKNSNKGINNEENNIQIVGDVEKNDDGDIVISEKQNTFVSNKLGISFEYSSSFANSIKEFENGVSFNKNSNTPDKIIVFKINSGETFDQSIKRNFNIPDNSKDCYTSSYDMGANIINSEKRIIDFPNRITMMNGVTNDWMLSSRVSDGAGAVSKTNSDKCSIVYKYPLPFYLYKNKPEQFIYIYHSIQSSDGQVVSPTTGKNVEWYETIKFI